MKSSKSYYLVYFFLLCSCASKDKLTLYKDVIEETLIDSILYTYKAMVVLPKSGCTGCISSAESFVISELSKNESNLYVVLTDITSIKTARFKLGRQVLESTHVFLDKENQFYQGDLWSLYPTILYVREGQIISLEQISPENTNALEKLSIYLD